MLRVALRPCSVMCFQKLGRVWKKQLVPRIAAPTFGVAGLVEGLCTGTAGTESEMPVHIDDEDVERDVIAAEATNEIFQFLIAVSPVTRPPGSESKARWHRNAAGNFNEVSERLLVIVAIFEEVPILAVAGRPLHHPGPRAIRAIDEAEIVRIKERPRRIVDDRPAVA